MGNISSSRRDHNLTKRDPEKGYIYCGTCLEWRAGTFVIGSQYPCFNESCDGTLTAINYPPQAHYYNCTCGNIDKRNHYVPLPKECSRCGRVVRPTLEAPAIHYFLCKCRHYWEKLCYGDETDICVRCGFNVIPRREAPGTWHFWCRCGAKRALTEYRTITLPCPRKNCEEMIKGRPDAPTIKYYFCQSCNTYFKDLGYSNLRQPCKNKSVCKAFVVPTDEPRLQYYLCTVCWMYFEIKSEPNEELTCRRMGCTNIVTPSLSKPDPVYVKGGVFVPLIPKDKHLPKKSCYFICRCTVVEGNYWIEHKWNPTVTQYCNTCKCDVYPLLQPPLNRQHIGYFNCRGCGCKWRSDKAYPEVSQSCPECATSCDPIYLDVKSYKERGIVV